MVKTETPARTVAPAAGNVHQVQRVRSFLIVQTATFFAAASLHLGLLTPAYAFLAAAIPESLIGSVLLIGLAATWIRPATFRSFGIVAQGFALAGTFVGIFAILAGIGPRTVLDLAIHGTMVVELATGLIVTARSHTGSTEASAWAA